MPNINIYRGLIKKEMEPNTHLGISPVWVGEPLEISQGKAVAQLITNPEMCADDLGLVHGGFTFGLADYAAMLAVNDPYVVLGGAETRFLSPVKVGDKLIASAEVVEEKGKKRIVMCKVETRGQIVFEGSFSCFILDRHVMDS